MVTAIFYGQSSKTFNNKLEAQDWANNNGYVWYDSMEKAIEDVEDGIVEIKDTMLINA